MGVEKEKCENCDANKQERSAIGGGPGEILDLIVDRDGESASGAGDVAPDHEDDSEFTDGVGKAKCGRGDEGVGRKGEQNSCKRAPAPGAEQASLLQQRGVN